MKAIFLALCAVSLGAPLWGQTWQSETFDTGALYHGAAFAPEGSLTFSCTAPSLQGLDLIQTGDHESTRTDTPFDMVVSFGINLVDPFQAQDPVLRTATITLDGVPFALPVIEYSDFYGRWTGWTQMTDALFPALQGAREMIVYPGLGTAYSYPTDGLPEALRAAMGYCLQGWEQQGERTPDALTYARLEVPFATGIAPGWTIGDVQDLGNAACEALALFDPEAPILRDFDGDGQTNLVLDWGEITCPYADPAIRRGAGACGAASCAIDFHMTTQGDVQSVLGIGASVVEDARGVSLVAIGGSLRDCSQVGLEACAFHYDLSSGTPEWLGPVATGEEAAAIAPADPVPGQIRPGTVEAGGGRAGPAPSDIGYDAIRSSTLPGDYALAPLLPLLEPPPQTIVEYLGSQCAGGYNVDIGHVQSADIDGDGIQDYVLNWAGMQCGPAGFAETGCGAGNCLIDVFLSARGYLPPEQMLGALADVVLDPRGRIGLLLWGTPFVCADGFCDTPFYWNGTTLAQ